MKPGTSNRLHHVSKKPGSRHYVTRNNSREMFGHLKHANVSRGLAVSDITLNVQNVAHLYGHKPGSPSPFVNRLINNSLLCARPDLSQTLLRSFFQTFHELIQTGLLSPLVGNSFISLWASWRLNSYIHFFIKIRSSLNIPTSMINAVRYVYGWYGIAPQCITGVSL